MKINRMVTTTRQLFFDSTRGNIALLLMISFLLFFTNINGWDLWNPDEPRYAQVAREMWDTGEWVLPHVNSEIYPDKPPLFFWLIGLCSFVTGGVTEISARIPSAFAATGCMLLTFFLGKRLHGRQAGLIASLVLMTSLEFFWLGRRGNIDMTLTLFVTLALTFFFLEAEKEDKSWKFQFLPFIFMGLGVLTKGPVGFLLPFLVIIIYCLTTRSFHTLRQLRIFRGLILVAAIVAAWLIPACIRGGEAYTNEILFTQNAGRFFDAWNHQQPFYYYFYVFPVEFMPWAVFLPGSLWWEYSHERKERRTRFFFPLCWFLTVFVFFSASSCKRNLYVLPLYPAAALLVGQFISGAFSRFDRESLPFKSLVAPFYGLGSLLLALGVGVSMINIFDITISGFSISGILDSPVSLAIVGSVLGGGGMGLMIAAREKNIRAGFAALVGLMIAVLLVATNLVLPQMNYLKSAKPMSRTIIRQVRGGADLVAFRAKIEPFNFYTGLNKIKVVRDEKDLRQYFESPWEGIILMRDKDYENLQKQSLLPEDIFVLDRDVIGHRGFVLLATGGFAGKNHLSDNGFSAANALS